MSSLPPLTYKLLFETQERLAAKGALNAQTAANRATALRSFLAFNCVQVDDLVGDELRSSFSKRCQEFREHLAASGKAARTISNTLSTLRPLRAMVVAIETERALAGDNLSPFNEALQSLFKDKPAGDIAKHLGIPRSMIYGWLKGKNVKPSSEHYVHRLENYFALQYGELSQLAGISGGKHIKKSIGEPVRVPYRENLAERTGKHFYFKPEVDSPLRSQWLDFMKYKTDLLPRLNRTNIGVWRVSNLNFKAEKPNTWSYFLDGKEVPTAKFAWTKTAGYLGWLNLPTIEGGAGIPADELHTMAWFVDKDLIHSYINWLLKQSSNKVNGFFVEFCSLVKSLLRQGTGYLRQQPNLLATLPIRYSDKNWDELCQEAYSVVESILSRLSKNKTQTRDPKAPMKHILDLPNPLEPIADMVQRMRADRPIGGSPIREAAWARDIFLVKLVVSNPLRLRNIATLTWKADNSGQLYQRADGSWWINIERENFKNYRGAAGEEDYDMPVQESVWPDLERYIKKFRKVLMKCDTDYVFLAAVNRPPYRDNSLPWADMSKRIFTLTKKYLWRCPGISLHAFRHLVATALVKKSEMNDYKTAALVLNDRMATVERNYAHLRSADAAKKMQALLGDTLRRM